MCLPVHSVRNHKVCQTHESFGNMLHILCWSFLKLPLIVPCKICSRVQVQDLSSYV